MSVWIRGALVLTSRPVVTLSTLWGAPSLLHLTCHPLEGRTWVSPQPFICLLHPALDSCLPAGWQELFSVTRGGLSSMWLWPQQGSLRLAEGRQTQGQNHQGTVFSPYSSGSGYHREKVLPNFMYKYKICLPVHRSKRILKQFLLSFPSPVLQRPSPFSKSSRVWLIHYSFWMKPTKPWLLTL